MARTACQIGRTAKTPASTSRATTIGWGRARIHCSRVVPEVGPVAGPEAGAGLAVDMNRLLRISQIAGHENSGQANSSPAASVQDLDRQEQPDDRRRGVEQEQLRDQDAFQGV